MADAVDLGAEAGVLGIEPLDVAVQRRHALPGVLQLGDPAVAEEEGNEENDRQHAGKERDRF